MNLSTDVKVTKFAATASAGTEILTDAIDMQGFDGVLIMCTMATANAANHLKGQQCDTSGGTYADLAGSAVTPGADGDVLILDLFQPRERYIKGSVIRAGADTQVGEIYVVQYKGKKRPEDNNSGIYNSVLLQSPAEGTA